MRWKREIERKRSVWYIWLKRQLNKSAAAGRCIGWLSWAYIAFFIFKLIANLSLSPLSISDLSLFFFSFVLCFDLCVIFIHLYSFFGICGSDDVVLLMVYLLINKQIYLFSVVRFDFVHTRWMSDCLSHRKTAFADKSISTWALERSSSALFVFAFVLITKIDSNNFN